MRHYETTAFRENNWKMLEAEPEKVLTKEAYEKVLIKNSAVYEGVESASEFAVHYSTFAVRHWGGR